MTTCSSPQRWPPAAPWRRSLGMGRVRTDGANRVEDRVRGEDRLGAGGPLPPRRWLDRRARDRRPSRGGRRDRPRRRDALHGAAAAGGGGRGGPARAARGQTRRRGGDAARVRTARARRGGGGG